jgi:hypothetical protein
MKSGEKTMNPTESHFDASVEPKQDNVPSADFICAISDFLDTDPGDILQELGYYDRDETLSDGRQPHQSS